MTNVWGLFKGEPFTCTENSEKKQDSSLLQRAKRLPVSSLKKLKTLIQSFYHSGCQKVKTSLTPRAGENSGKDGGRAPLEQARWAFPSLPTPLNIALPISVSCRVPAAQSTRFLSTGVPPLRPLSSFPALASATSIWSPLQSKRP